MRYALRIIPLVYLLTLAGCGYTVLRNSNDESQETEYVENDTITSPGISRTHQFQIPTIALDVKYLGPHKIVTGETKSIPPLYLYKYEGYDFLIKISMTIPPGSSILDSLLGVVCVWPNSDVQNHIIVPSQIIMISDGHYIYSMTLYTLEQTWIDLFITTAVEMQTVKEKREYKQTSNLERIFLTIPDK